MSGLTERTERSLSAIGNSSFARAAIALAGAAAAGALAVLALPGLGSSLYPHPPEGTLDADAGTALALVAHNVPVALWPLALVALDWHEIPAARHLADALVAFQLAAHGASVGAALATWPELVRWLPHLPAEWTAIAPPCAAWVAARRGAPAAPATLLLAAAATLALLALAAALETWVAPS